ncbi:MAG: SsrA-binding protein SmpB [Candidatus Eisenbacteria bacterium]|uniref:SsrA-binding protein n=1 Tax=Eiseniibacteriota bacterium TaxID=2212470 RepID=A0A7Y2E6L9_UNCEI|nr:SsrA-binding protein SmpB [Candidatus Eisenbacteria bacterium]
MAAKKSKEPSDIKLIAQNRKARHLYHILEVFEAGLVLTGTEVKSLRAGKASLGDSYAVLEGSELWLHKLHIGHYEQGNRFNHEILRRRKLLLNAREIRKLLGKVQEKGLTIVPTKIYFKKGWAKVEIAVVKGKKDFDKRQDLAKRDADRDMERAMSRKNR